MCHKLCNRDRKPVVLVRRVPLTSLCIILVLSRTSTLACTALRFLHRYHTFKVVLRFSDAGNIINAAAAVDDDVEPTFLVSISPKRLASRGSGLSRSFEPP